MKNTQTKKIKLVQNAPTQNTKTEKEVSAKCTNLY